MVSFKGIPRFSPNTLGHSLLRPPIVPPVADSAKLALPLALAFALPLLVGLGSDSASSGTPFGGPGLNGVGLGPARGIRWHGANQFFFLKEAA